MKAVIQRVSNASVAVEGEIIGKIGTGYLILLGVSDCDTEKDADILIHKITGLRIFTDENGKTNLSIRDVGGEMLVISQFTLMADCRKGRRPSFVKAGDPKEACRLYEYFITQCKKQGEKVAQGQFGAMMEVSLVNDGPFTIVLDSEELKGKK